MALTVEDIVERCRNAITEHAPVLAIRDVLDELVGSPNALAKALGPVDRGGISSLYNSDDLTILHAVWTPGMALYPHEHRMWAAIGIYGGQEDNAFYRRTPGGLAPSGGREVAAGEVLVLGDDAVHSVENTHREFAVALHVYGGNFFTVERSEWTFDTFEQRVFDLDRAGRLFEEANERWLRSAATPPPPASGVG